MAGATAFFTTFALPAILIILFQVSRLFMGQEILGPALRNELTKTIGPEAVEQVLSVAKAMRGLTDNPLVAAGGFVFLMFVATTLFNVISASINEIWSIKITSTRNFKVTMVSRLRSLIIILVIGLLLIVNLIFETIRAFIGQYINSVPENVSAFFRSFLNDGISFVLITCWFALVFRFLSLGRPKWKVAFVGGVVTSVLFTMGKFVLRALLNLSNLNTIFGTSSIIVFLLLFVFYSSLILYYGASFTEVFARHVKKPIRTLPYANYYKREEVVTEDPKEEQQ
jgi:membrane protein